MPDLKQDLRSYFDRLVEDADEFASQHRVSAAPSSERRGHWLVAVVAAVLVVVLMAGVTVLLRGGSENPTVEASTRRPREVTSDELLSEESNLEVFMITAATRREVAAVRQALIGSESIRRFAFLNHKAALREYRRHTRDNPALSDDVTADLLPESFRIELRDCSVKSNLESFLGQLPGVDEVVLNAGLSHNLAKKYDNTSNLEDLPPKTLRGTCGGRLPSRAEFLREAEAATTSTTP